MKHSECNAGNCLVIARSELLLGCMESLTTLGQTLASPERGCNHAAIVEALFDHIDSVFPFECAGVFFFDAAFELHFHSCRPLLSEALLRQLVDEAIDAGLLAHAIQHNRALYQPAETGPSILLHIIGTRERELGMFVGMAQDPNLFSDSALLAALGASLCLVGSAFENLRQYTDLSRQNQELWDDLGRRTKAYAVATQEAQDANRAKSDFLAAMSHELRTPLNAIIGMMELLAGDQRLDNDQQESVQTVVTAADSLMTIIDDVLDFSKIEAGKMTLERIPFQPVTVLREVQDLLAPRIAGKGLTLTVDQDLSDNAWFEGDPLRLRQILLNLIGNAVKFTEAGGIRVHLRHLHQPGLPSRLELQVQDTGIGIPPERRPFLFQAFSQTASHIGRRYGGSGLGLAIVARLAELMHGGVEVHSEPGTGSTFVVTLQATPCQQPSNVVERTVSREEAVVGHVCVVEDNSVNRMVIQRMLERLGVQVSMRVDGPGVLADLGSQRYDIILMDVEMPVLDGYETTQRIREWEQINGGHVPIVALTAHAMQEHVRRALAAGMDDHLSKPVHMRELRDVLHRYIGSHTDGPASGGSAPTRA